MRWTILLITMLLGGCGTAVQTALELDAARETIQAAPLTPHAIAPTPSHNAVAQNSTPQNPTPSAPIVQVFHAAPDCSRLVSQAVAVPEATLDQAVGAAIAQFETADFPLAGYRVQHQPDSPTVTIELRLPPDSSRSLTALSQCEQFALFGGLRETVMQFEPGQVQTVEFQVHDAAIGS